VASTFKYKYLALIRRRDDPLGRCGRQPPARKWMRPVRSRPEAPLFRRRD